MYHLSGDWCWVCGEGPRGSRTRNKMTLMCDDMESHLLILFLGFPGGSAGKESTCNMGDLGLIPGLEDPLENGTATHSSILPWRISWTIQSMQSQRVGHT